MSLVKETYDAVRSRERISFGGFRFVIPSESFAVPKFACCEGKHDGVIEEDRCNFDNSFNLVNCANEVQNIIGRNPSFERITSIPFPLEKEMDFSELKELSDSSHEQNSKNTAGSLATTASVNDGTTLHKSIISEDKPIGDIVAESDSEEIIFRDYSSDNILLDVTNQDDIMNSVTVDPYLKRSNKSRNYTEDKHYLSNPQLVNSNNTFNNDSDDSFYDDVVEFIKPSTSNSSDYQDNEDVEYCDEQRQRHDMHGQFRGFLRDDGDQFDNDIVLLGQERRDELYKTLKDKFGFNSFRHRQKTAITAILLEHDAFVLMPTGAGKSLCYQLPAVLSQGVTIVVSPLRSLIEDQKFKMKELDIPCEALTAEVNQAEQEIIYSRLMRSPPDIKLLYVTPEKISASGRLASVFSNLHKRKHLARFVIDEAHCVSQWGHDFRPDYTKLCSLRRDYGTPKVPIIALTATATPKIVTDTRDHLSIPNSKLFISSFVRTNLKYDLIPKASKTLISVVEKMKQLYPGKSGIIYCLSRKECETVASSLMKAGMSADVYHAGLADKARIDVQHRWLANRVDVICATIAFGMGIDKPDVRFVIHFSLPKSIEGYYQETGRAGRDGLPSYCLMLYSYQDSIRLRRMIEGDNSTVGVRSMHLQSIYQVVSYCENVSVCRRKLLVEHFGEVYDAQACRRSSTPCDVCERYKKNPSSIRLFDVSEEARLVLTAMARMNNITLRYLAELYRGQMIKKNSEQAMRLGHNSLPFFGRGNGMSEQDALRFMRKLVVEGYILERIYTTKFENTVAYAELTDKGRGVSTGHITSKVYLHITTGDSRRKSSSIEMINMNAVSEAQALKEKHMVKHGDVFTRCLRALTDVISEMAEQARLPGPYSILSREGIEQIAALLPRTNSDLLQADTMTAGKVDRYGAKIMTTLKPFWKEVDECDEAEMRKQLERLKKSEEVMGGFAPAPHSIVPPLSSLGDNRKFAPRFGRGGATKGRVIRATPKLRKKTSGGSQQSSGGVRGKKIRPSFRVQSSRGRGMSKVGRTGLDPRLFPA